MASDDAVGTTKVEVRARTVPVIVPLNSPAKEVFVLVEDTLLALFFREAMLSDVAEFLLLWLILLVVMSMLTVCRARSSISNMPPDALNS